jgi:hypothetical protein
MTGYRKLPTDDPEEERLREAWYATRDSADPSDMGSMLRHQKANTALVDFLWRRASAIVAADRAKHPKAKRNLPVGAEGSNKTRALP